MTAALAAAVGLLFAGVVVAARPSVRVPCSVCDLPTDAPDGAGRCPACRWRPRGGRAILPGAPVPPALVAAVPAPRDA